MEWVIGLGFLAILYVLYEIRNHQKEDRARKNYEEYQKKNPPFRGTPKQEEDFRKERDELIRAAHQESKKN